jgi:nicotinate-nucleotide--dimethylbenzimidazole phosphoribosyltransferase
VDRHLGRILESIRPLDNQVMEAARARQDSLTKPQGSLGRLEHLAIKIAGIKGEALPALGNKAIVTMAADHGVVEEGVSAYPQEVTGQMVQNFLQGGAAINVLARLIGARVVVVDMGVSSGLEADQDLLGRRVAPGTGNMASGAAMTRDQALQAVGAGIDIVESEVASGLDIIGTGDMGIGNTTAGAAICAAITGWPVQAVVGRGTGVDDTKLANKVRVVRQALEANQPDPSDPLDVLAKVGGFEIGGLVGVMLGAAAHRIPVVLDGFISGSAALIATGLSPLAEDYFIAAHKSAELGHKAVLAHLRLTPLLDLNMRLGEGTGAALGIFLAEAAVRTMSEMATFDEARVARKS